jgi:hypothetical protein
MTGVEEPETVTILVIGKNARTEIHHTRRRLPGSRELEPFSAVLKRATEDARTWMRRNG